MSQLRILIAEDEEHTLREIHRILNQAGHEVLPYAYSAEDAIRKAEKFDPDLIIMDINFSDQGKDGIYAADHIRKQLNKPVVYVTGAVDQETVERAKLTSPYSYVLKPIEKHKILVSIELARHNWEVDQKLRQHERAVSRAYIEGQDQHKIQLEDALHEGLGVRLSAMGFYVSMIQDVCNQVPSHVREEFLGKACSHLNELDALLKDATKALRRISFDLVPNTLINNGLAAGIQALEARLLESDPDLDLNLELEQVGETEPAIRLSQDLELGIYWLVFDLVDYYRNHAGSQEVVMQICLSWHEVTINIQENTRITSWCVNASSNLQIRNQKLEARLNLLEAQLTIPPDQPIDRPYRIIHISVPVSQKQLN